MLRAFAVGCSALAVVVAVARPGAAPLSAGDDHMLRSLDALVSAYPDQLAGHDGQVLRWRDGTVMSLGDVAARPFAEMLRQASIIDQLRIPYPHGALPRPPARDADPGRFRNTTFFRKMYGDCAQNEVSGRLASIVWLPKSWGKRLQVTVANGVDARLRAVSAEIDALPEAIRRAAYPSAGTYNCRAVADTGAPSTHGYGIAIDLNTAVADYWFWQRHASDLAYRNRVPREIVAIFEKHGFIWGGKWYHFDTMHFEYRPELLADDN